MQRRDAEEQSSSNYISVQHCNATCWNKKTTNGNRQRQCTEVDEDNGISTAGIPQKNPTASIMPEACKMDETKEVQITVNGKPIKVINPSPNLHLGDWLRDTLHLKAAKQVCGEGGCGSCVVAISTADPIAHPESISAVNSCLQPIISLDGCHVITAEGIGGKKNGFHPLQNVFAEKFAAQCGYCTPGIVMSSFSYLANSGNERSKEEIEKCIDGHICRCTGYRPILDAIKYFSTDNGALDIEDFHNIRSCQENCLNFKARVIKCNLESQNECKWYSPSSLSDLFALIESLGEMKKSFKLVAGNTSVGIFKDYGPYHAYIGLKHVKEFREKKTSEDGIEIGAGLTLTELMCLLHDYAHKSKSFDVIREHLEKIASFPIRNAGTWAGNLMLFSKDENFPSDIYTIFSAIHCRLQIADFAGSISSVTLDEFIELDLKTKIIISAKIPFCKDDETVRCYTIMPRKQNSYGYVNAGFYAQFDDDELRFKSKPRLYFGGVGLKRTKAIEVENFLAGKILNERVLKDALGLIQKQLEEYPSNKMVNFEFCKKAAGHLFYKFCVQLLRSKIPSRILSTIQSTVPASSSGEQTFHQSEDESSMVHKPYQRIEGKLQASGETQFVSDLPARENEAFAAFVLSTVGNAKLEDIDITEAKAHPGFIAFVSAKDIPGTNNWRSPPNQLEIFATKDIGYHGQPLGLIIADTQRHAQLIAKLVKVKYSDVKKPVTSLREAIALEQFHEPRFRTVSIGDTEEAFKSCDHVIEGDFESGSQHHFYIEPQACLVVPNDVGFQVFSTTQCSRLVQFYVSRALGVKASSIEVTVPRLGGAFGGKIEYPSGIASAVAVAANALDRPVRINLGLNDSLKMIGKRAPFVTKYKVGFSKAGRLQACEIVMYNDTGIIAENADGFIAGHAVDNAYFCPNWNVRVIDCKTNTPFNTFVRGPGHVQGTIIMEVVFDHIATVLGKENPDDVKELNLYQDGQATLVGHTISDCLLTKLWSEIKQKSAYEKRRNDVLQFNRENRWKKRGISLMPLLYPNAYYTFNFTAMVTIYYADGTVAISSGGIEMGQGMNTRVCQVVANQLKIPLDIITIHSHSTTTSPNSYETGGSIASELNSLAVFKCCEILNERMKPVKESMPDASWLEMIKECAKKRIDLSSQYMFYDVEKFSYAYTVYAAACSEVEVDVLTGEHAILRSDIVYDCGESINPRLDVGQLEGAFVMSIGYWFTEKVVYDEETGKQLTVGTWTYKPPTSKDIPLDMRVHLKHEAVNPIGFVRSKAVGEPASCLTPTCLFAAKNAIKAARAELNKPNDCFQLDGPATPDKIQKLCQVDDKALTFA